MKGNIEERACELAAYIIENRATVREAARRFGISKSTVHTDVTKWNGRQGRTDFFATGSALCEESLLPILPFFATGADSPLICGEILPR